MSISSFTESEKNDKSLEIYQNEQDSELYGLTVLKNECFPHIIHTVNLTTPTRQHVYADQS